MNISQKILDLFGKRPSGNLESVFTKFDSGVRGVGPVAAGAEDLYLPHLSQQVPHPQHTRPVPGAGHEL